MSLMQSACWWGMVALRHSALLMKMKAGMVATVAIGRAIGAHASLSADIVSMFTALVPKLNACTKSATESEIAVIAGPSGERAPRGGGRVVRRRMRYRKVMSRRSRRRRRCRLPKARHGRLDGHPTEKADGLGSSHDCSLQEREF